MLSRLWSLRRDRPLFVWSSVAVLAFLLAYPFADWYLRSAGIAPQFVFWDFGVYAGAVERWQTGELLYVPNDDGGYHGSYLYPPPFLVVVHPFTLLPFRAAAIAWEGFSVLLLWAGLQTVVTGLGGEIRLWERGVLLWAMLGFQPLLFSVKQGQVAAFFTAILCFALVSIVGPVREDRVSGAFTAFAGVLKLPYAPSGAHLLRNRNRLIGAVGVALALGVLSLLFFGVEPHLNYLEVLQWGIESDAALRSPELWLPAYYRPLYVVGGSLVLRLGISAGIVALTLLAASKPVDRETFALGVAAVPLLAPRTYTYYFVALLPAIAVLLAVELERDGHPVVPVVAVALLNLHSYGLKFLVDHLPVWLPARSVLIDLSPVLQPGLWGNVLVVGLAATRVARATSIPPAVQRRIGRVGGREEEAD